MLGNALISLSGKKWRDMRATLSPAFTGSKMRQMLGLVVSSTGKAIKSATEQIKEPGNDVIEMKEFFSKFTIDIIASCAFGLEVDTFKHPNNDFKRVADRTMKPNAFFAMIKFALLYFVPKFMKMLDISLLEGHTKQFFRQTVNETMNYREKNEIVRPDMIHLLMQTKNGILSHDGSSEKSADSISAVDESEIGKSKVTTVWKNDELVAQCLLFFLAGLWQFMHSNFCLIICTLLGFDTTSTALAFSAHELAVNPDIQNRLRQEIQDVEASLTDKELNYETLLKMKYLDQFVTEILRKWAPSPGIERYCVKDFTFELDGKTITIPKDHSVLIPAYAWHRDPLHFPNPDSFDPDRFNSENIKNQNLNNYAPFGIGPRNCIGSRFALMNVKTVLYYMLLNFTFEVTEKTQIPLKYKKSMMVVGAENGFWVQLKPIKS